MTQKEWLEMASQKIDESFFVDRYLRHLGDTGRKILEARGWKIWAWANHRDTQNFHFHFVLSGIDENHLRLDTPAGPGILDDQHIGTLRQVAVGFRNSNSKEFELAAKAIEKIMADQGLRVPLNFIMAEMADHWCERDLEAGGTFTAGTPAEGANPELAICMQEAKAFAREEFHDSPLRRLQMLRDGFDRAIAGFEIEPGERMGPNLLKQVEMAAANPQALVDSVFPGEEEVDQDGKPKTDFEDLKKLMGLTPENEELAAEVPAEVGAAAGVAAVISAVASIAAGVLETNPKDADQYIQHLPETIEPPTQHVVPKTPAMAIS